MRAFHAGRTGQTWTRWVLSLTLLGSVAVAGDAVFRIRTGEDYKRYGGDELRRRVWELERAVAQLQARVYQLEATPVATPPPPPPPWTCRVTAFGKLYAATATSRGEALTRVMRDCTTNHNAMFCGEDSIQCSQ